MLLTLTNAIRCIQGWSTKQKFIFGVAAHLAMFGAIGTLRALWAHWRHPPKRLRANSCGISTLLAAGGYNVGGNFHPLITCLMQFVKNKNNDSCPCQHHGTSKQHVTEGELHPCCEFAIPFMERLTQHQRFRSIPLTDKPGNPVVWVTQAIHFPKHCFHHVARSAAEFDEILERVVNEPLSRDKPWWELHVVCRTYSNYDTTFPGVSPRCFLLKIHHAVGDGVSLADASVECVWDEKKQFLSMASVFAPRNDRDASAADSTAHRSAPVVQKGKNFILKILRTVWTGIEYGAIFPICFLFNAVRVFSRAWVPVDTGPHPLHDPYRKKFGEDAPQHTVFFPSHKLDLVKKIRKLVDPTGTITVNDIEFALAAGMMRRFFASNGTKLPTLFRALTPFAQFEKPLPLDTRYNALLRNKFIFLTNPLPIHCDNAIGRVKESSKTWFSLKKSTIVPATVFVFATVGGLLPLWLRQFFSRSIQRNHSVMFSNVPGPHLRVFLPQKDAHGSLKGKSDDEPVYEIAAVHIMCPCINPYVALFSLNGWVHFAGTFFYNVEETKKEEAGQKRKKEIVGMVPTKIQLDKLRQHFFDELLELSSAVGISKEQALASISPL